MFFFFFLSVGDAEDTDNSECEQTRTHKGMNGTAVAVSTILNSLACEWAIYTRYVLVLSGVLSAKPTFNVFAK